MQERPCETATRISTERIEGEALPSILSSYDTLRWFHTVGGQSIATLKVFQMVVVIIALAALAPPLSPLPTKLNVVLFLQMAL